jgi:hypothetical protein
VNRILGPEEDLIDALAKSLRVARRERGEISQLRKLAIWKIA